MYIILAAVLCVTLCFGVIYPLWLFSTSNPVIYTKAVLFAVLLFIVFTFIRKFILSYKCISQKESRKKFCFRMLLWVAVLIVIALSALLIISSVLQEHRLTALIILVAGSAIAAVLVKIRKRLADV